MSFAPLRLASLVRPGVPGRPDAPRSVAGRRPTCRACPGRRPRPPRGRKRRARPAEPALVRTSRRGRLRPADVGLVGPAGLGRPSRLAAAAREALAWCAGRRRAAAVPAGGTGVPGAGAAAERGAPTGCRPPLQSRSGPLPRGRCRCVRGGRTRGGGAWGGWLKRHGGAGIQGHPPGRAAPGSRASAGAPASASAVRTRIRPARGGARAPRWPPAKGWRAAGAGRPGRRRLALRPTGASGPASWARMPSGPTVSELALWGPTVSELALSRLAADGCGARRNHPAGGATPGQELSSPADPSAACPSAAGSGFACPGLACPGAWLGGAGSGESSACGWRGPGIIRPGGTDQGEPDFPDHPSGTALYAAAPPLARNHVDDSHSTGHSLYSSQTPVRAHFWQNALTCRSSHPSRPYGITRGLMLPIESEDVYEGHFSVRPTEARPSPRRAPRPC